MNSLKRILDTGGPEPPKQNALEKAESCFNLLCKELANRMAYLKRDLETSTWPDDGGLEVLVVNEDREADNQGQYREFSTNLATIKLYVNQPPGWIIGEYTYAHPFARTTYRFAQSFVRTEEGEYPKRLYGALKELPSNLMKDVAQRLIEVLFTAVVSEDDLMPYVK